MSFDYINEAFKRLDLLEEDMFDTSMNGINKLADFLDNDEEVVTVIDPNATSEEDLADSYVGKVIMNCNVCHSHIFEDKENIEITEDGEVNKDSTCPYCGEALGFVVVGEIAPFNAETTEEEEKPAEEAETEEVDENLTEAVKVVGNKPMGTDYRPAFEKIARVVDGKFDFIDDLVVDVDRVIMVINRDINKDELSKVLAMMSNTQACKENKWHAVYTGMKDDKNVIIQFEYGSGMDLEVSSPEEELEEAIPAILGAMAVAAAPVIADKLLDDYNPARDDANKTLRQSKATKRATVTEETSLEEDFKEVSITTDDQHMEMTSDDNGKVTITTEPVAEEVTFEETAEVIAPVSDETTEEILANNELEEEPVEDVVEEQPIEELIEETELDVEFDEVDEEGFDELGEGYLRKMYENVESFKTTDVSATDSQLIIEGVIKFTSGVEKKTGFLFEAKDFNNKGQLRFIGTNKHLTEAADAFALVGRVDNKKLFVESLKYNHTIEETLVRGVIRRK